MSNTWTVPEFGEGWMVPGYTEEREIGKGATGRVVQAVDNETGQVVAIKYLSYSLVRDAAFMWSFRSDVQRLHELGVPQVAALYDYVEQPGAGAAVISELVVGISLHEIIERRGQLAAETALTVLKSSLLGLSAAHTLGIVHRDFKPENVLVDTRGNVRLVDFGIAIRWGKEVPVGGTPLYMAPELWHGAPSSPESDLYAATAVFFECLTAKTPFSGKLTELRDQHMTAPVPLELIDPALRGLIAEGMAKNPSGRPQSAIAFVSELEAMATATYGPNWEERGRYQLAALAGEILPLVQREGRPSTSNRSYAVGDNRKRRALTVVAAAAAIVLVGGGVAAATVLHGGNGNAALTSQSSNQSSASSGSTTFTAVTNATPPLAQSATCKTPTPFTFSATLSANGPGTVQYQWVYSSGKDTTSGPVQTANFTAAGSKKVTGEKISATKAVTGWGAIKEISPVPKTLDTSTYELVCGSDSQVIPNAWIPVPPTSFTCGTAPTPFTAQGNIYDAEAGTVTYHWLLSDGTTTPSQTLVFPKAQKTLNASPVTITPPDQAGSGSAVLVVTSPGTSVSQPATYTTTCTQAATVLTATVSASPAAQSLATCTTAVAPVTFTGTVSDSRPGTVSYHWVLPSGAAATQTLDFTTANSSKTVSTTYTPTSDSATGTAQLVVSAQGATGLVSASSNAAAFTVACGPKLTLTSAAAGIATVGTAYTGTVTASGGKAPYTWAAATGLPAGLKATASGATLTISGTPTTVVTSTVALSVKDSGTPAGSGATTVTIVVSDKAITLTSAAPATATTGTAYTGTVTAAGGSGTYTWTATGLPAGLSAAGTGATATISGTPTTAGQSTATVSVRDSAGGTASTTVTITVSAPVTPVKFTATNLPLTGTIGTAYTGSVTATGGTGTITYSAAGLPTGLAMSAAGAVTGTPTAAGAFVATITATPATGTAATETETIVIAVATPVTPPPTTSTAKATTTATASADPSVTVTSSASPTLTDTPTVTVTVA